MASMYSCSSLVGFVSSKRRWQRPPNSRGDAEVQADRLGVADVEVAVRLGREARDHRRVPAAAQVVGHDLADEVARLRRSVRVVSSLTAAGAFAARSASAARRSRRRHDLLAQHGQGLEEGRRGGAAGHGHAHRHEQVLGRASPSASANAAQRRPPRVAAFHSSSGSTALLERAPRSAFATSAGVRPFGHHRLERLVVVGDLAREEEAPRSRRSPPACRCARGRAAAPAQQVRVGEQVAAQAADAARRVRQPAQVRARSARSASRGRTPARPARSAPARRPATNSSSVNSSRSSGIEQPIRARKFSSASGQEARRGGSS